ncbi:MAG: hypothetical protein AAGE93_22890 [Bacteroidota bacterium]
MKTTGIILTILLGISLSTHAQSELSKKIGFGGQITQIQRDFGIGLNLTSPHFANGRSAIRLRTNIMWNEHLNNDGETTWTSYSNISLGFVSIAREIGDFARLYGEGGVILLLPSDTFSSESIEFGGYGLFGFEFYMSNNANYFLEIGGVGTGAQADEVPNKPIYSNGLLISAGFRMQL